MLKNDDEDGGCGMYVLISVVAFVILLVVLIGIHELGHFLTARRFGIQVEEFGFGFPPRLWGRVRNGTLYSINALPLGGFVRLRGETGEWDDPRSFAAKPAWQRIVVLAAGAGMNLIGALLLFFLVYTVAPIPLDTPLVGLIQPGSPAAHTLKLGDLITAVDGHPVQTQTQVRDYILCAVGKPTRLSLVRDGHAAQVTVVPRSNPPPGQGAVGFAGSITYSGTDFPHAVGNALDQPVQFVQAIGDLFAQPACVPQAGVTGPVGSARVTGEAANSVPQLGLGPVLYLAALLSMNLAFVNLLPLPALDGGRIVFVLVGAARRRRIDPRREGLIHLIGFAFLLAVTLAVSAHDIGLWLQGHGG
jgi:regulator of sigma E protease